MPQAQNRAQNDDASQVPMILNYVNFRAGSGLKSPRSWLVSSDAASAMASTARPNRTSRWMVVSET